MLVPVPSLEIATDLLTHGLLYLATPPTACNPSLLPIEVNRHRYDWPLPLAYYWMNLED